MTDDYVRVQRIRVGTLRIWAIIGLVSLAACGGLAGAEETTFAPVLPADIRLSADFDESFFHDVVFDGTRYVVVWASHEVGRTGIRGQFIGTDGLLGASFLIADPESPTQPRIACIGGRYLVVYASSAGISGSIVEADGVVGPTIPICWATNVQTAPEVIPGASSLLVVWQDHRAHATNMGDVYGRFVSPSGAPEGDEFLIGPTLEHQRCPVGSFNGQDFLVFWTQEPETSSNVGDIHGARVSPDGTVLDPGGFPVCTAVASQSTAGAACASSPDGTTALAWVDRRTGLDILYSVRFSRDGSVLDGPAPSAGLPVFQDIAFPPACPSMTFNERDFVLFFGYNSRIVTALLGTDGTVTVPQRVPVTVGSSPVSSACAFDGTNYLVTWATARTGQIWAQLVTGANRLPVAEAGEGYSFQAVRGAGLMDGGASTDPDGDLPLTYRWNIVSKPANSYPSLSGGWTRIATLKASVAGEYAVELTVTDAHGAIGLPDRVTFTVTPYTNLAPVLDPIEPVSVTELQVIEIRLAGTDPDGDPVEYGVSFLPVGATFDLSTSTFTWTPSQDQAGTYYVKFWAKDSRGATSYRTVAITVADLNRAPVLTSTGDWTVDEEETIEITLDANDADGDILTYSVQGMPDGASFDGEAGHFTWTPSSEQSGDYPVVFSASDGKESDTDEIVIHVIDLDRTPPLITVPELQVIDPGNSIVIGVGDAISATVSLNGAVPTTLLPQEGSIVLPMPSIPGAYTVTVAAVDFAGNVADASFPVTIADRTPPAIAVPTDTDTLPPGGFEIRATDDSGRLTIAYAVDLDGQTVASGTGTEPLVIPATIFGETGSYTVKLTATDAAGNEATAGFSVDIDVATPIVDAIAATPNPSQVLTAIRVTAVVDDTAPCSSGVAQASYTLDGLSWHPMVASDGSFGGTVELVDATLPAFTSAGVYSIRLRVTDGAGNSGESSESLLLAVYDPSAGFVTGGGWIESPAGAYIEDPLMTGRATFGFVAKYRKGASVPTGQTEFQFRAAGFTFHSEIYDWLVVAGARAQFKGTGTIDGQGDYGFMLTAIDGAVNGGGGTDRFRIRIWDRASDRMVYDNEAGLSDAGIPSTALGGGAIIVHA